MHLSILLSNKCPHCGTDEGLSYFRVVCSLKCTWAASSSSEHYHEHGGLNKKHPQSSFLFFLLWQHCSFISSQPHCTSLCHPKKALTRQSTTKTGKCGLCQGTDTNNSAILMTQWIIEIMFLLTKPKTTASLQDDWSCSAVSQPGCVFPHRMLRRDVLSLASFIDSDGEETHFHRRTLRINKLNCVSALLQ